MRVPAQQLFSLGCAEMPFFKGLHAPSCGAAKPLISGEVPSAKKCRARKEIKDDLNGQACPKRRQIDAGNAGDNPAKRAQNGLAEARQHGLQRRVPARRDQAEQRIDDDRPEIDPQHRVRDCQHHLLDPEQRIAGKAREREAHPHEDARDDRDCDHRRRIELANRRQDAPQRNHQRIGEPDDRLADRVAEVGAHQLQQQAHEDHEQGERAAAR